MQQQDNLPPEGLQTSMVIILMNNAKDHQRRRGNTVRDLPECNKRTIICLLISCKLHSRSFLRTTQTKNNHHQRHRDNTVRDMQKCNNRTICLLISCKLHRRSCLQTMRSITRGTLCFFLRFFFDRIVTTLRYHKRFVIGKQEVWLRFFIHPLCIIYRV